MILWYCIIYTGISNKMIYRRKKWQEFAGVQEDLPNLRICSHHFESKYVRKKYPRPLLVRGAIPTVKPYCKSSSPPDSLIKYHNDKMEIYRSAIEGNLSKKHSLLKSVNDLEVFVN